MNCGLPINYVRKKVFFFVSISRYRHSIADPGMMILRLKIDLPWNQQLRYPNFGLSTDGKLSWGRLSNMTAVPAIIKGNPQAYISYNRSLQASWPLSKLVGRKSLEQKKKINWERWNAEDFRDFSNGARALLTRDYFTVAFTFNPAKYIKKNKLYECERLQYCWLTNKLQLVKL